jgi:hypothetical protein
MMILIVVVAMVLVVISVIPGAIVVPTMIVFEVSTVTLPVTRKELLPIVMRCDPAGTFIRRSRPIGVVPPIVPPVGIPIAIDPGKSGAGLRRVNPDHTRARWRADSDSNRNLRVKSR